MHIPLPIMAVDPQSLVWKNPILGQCRILKTTFAATDINVEFLETIDVRPNNYFVVNGGDFRLWIGLEDLDSLPFAESLDIQQISGLPKQILLGVVETLFADLLQTVSDQLGSTCRISDIVQVDDVDAEFERLGFCMKWDETGVARGVVAGNQATLQVISDLVERQPVNESIDADVLPIPIQLDIGQTSIELQDLQSLQLHDVLMMREPLVDASNQAIARFPSPLPSWRVTIGNQEVSFAEPLPSRPALDVAECSERSTIDVTFCRATCAMPVAEIRNLCPGTSIPAALKNEVTLVVDGKPFGSGELVAISGQHGVRLMAF